MSKLSFNIPVNNMDTRFTQDLKSNTKRSAYLFSMFINKI